MVTSICNPSTQKAEFETNLVYLLSSKSTRTTVLRIHHTKKYKTKKIQNSSQDEEKKNYLIFFSVGAQIEGPALRRALHLWAVPKPQKCFSFPSFKKISKNLKTKR